MFVSGRFWKGCLAAALLIGCSKNGDKAPAGGSPDMAMGSGDMASGATGDMAAGAGSCGTPAQCGTAGEEAASNKLDSVLNSPTDLAAFLKGMPKGGDLHNHLTGAVYAETYLAWAQTDGDCINSTTFSSVYSNQCTASTQPTPSAGTMFYDQIVDAWSMQDFVAGAQNGHDHFFATFGKYGAVAGAHRDDDLADVLKRAADENQLYVETMFNVGKNLGTLAGKVSTTTVTADGLEALYNDLLGDMTFPQQLANDVAVVNSAGTNYKTQLGCNTTTPSPACNVGLRFVAQVWRTGALDEIFGQLVSAYEMAAKTPFLVAANLSSPEDDSTSLKNYDLHMAMLDFLYNKYTVTGKSPLHVTLHAGELAPQYLPSAYSDGNTFHIRHAVETGHAERIGHGIDVMSETDPEGLLNEMHDKNVLVEVCLSSNAQILEVSGTAHPLAAYLAHNVPVALATDDQGVSRSSLAGEYQRAVTDQKLTYRQLKTMARNSLEHSFLPGASVWTSVADAQPVADCAPTGTMGLGDTPSAGCQTFLDGSERAKLQWQLETNFRTFESQQ